MAAARWYREVFKDNFFIEIQNHGLPEQLQVLPQLLDLARKLSIPLVASNDVHYLTREDADAREILICLQTGDVISNPDRAMKMESEQLYFKSSEEMAALFAAIPDCLDNTFEIASRCNFEFKLKKYFLPSFKTPGKLSIDDYFEKICLEGFERIQHQYLAKAKHLKHSHEEYQKRLLYEIEKIREMGFPGYFLIVWDIIRFAKESDIPVGPGRGSVVGSLVAFVMGITNIDPLEYDLIFERFLNPERVSLPDIDIDFDGERRDEVIDYIRAKYGEDNVAQIVTFGRMKAKLAIRDIGRVMEIKLSDVNRLAKMIPEGPKVELKDVIEKNPELQREIKHNPADGQTDQLRPETGKQHPPHLHARRRRGHRPQEADRVHAAVQDQGRHHHPFRKGRGGKHRPAEDGHPGSENPDHHQEHHPRGPGNARASASTWRTSTCWTARRSRSSRRATPTASSSSKARACATT